LAAIAAAELAAPAGVVEASTATAWVMPWGAMLSPC
jgi:hypothetical protein